MTFFQFQKINTRSLTIKQIVTTASVLVLYNIIYVIVVFSIINNFNALDISSKISARNKIIFFSNIFLLMHNTVSFIMALITGYYQLVGLNRFIQSCIDRRIKLSNNEVITKVSMVYDKICDAFDAISQYFLISNLIFFAAFIFFNILYHYSIYVYFKTPSVSIIYFVHTALVWSSYYTPAIFLMISFSHWIQKEGRMTADLVQDLANQENSVKSLRLSYRMTLMVAHRKPSITCGLYELNWKFFFAIVSSIFSFTIIIIQFYDVSKS